MRVGLLLLCVVRDGGFRVLPMEGVDGCEWVGWCSCERWWGVGLGDILLCRWLVVWWVLVMNY